MVGCLGRLQVSIDNQWVGRVGRKTPGCYRVPPGQHTLAAKIDWVRTHNVSIDVNVNDRVVFCCTEGGAWGQIQLVGMGEATGHPARQGSTRQNYPSPALGVFHSFTVVAGMKQGPAGTPGPLVGGRNGSGAGAYATPPVFAPG
jgi:hypothetical protein